MKLLGLKKAVLLSLHRNKIYNKIQMYRLEKKIARSEGGFHDFVAYEYSKNRLGKIDGFEHPHGHFNDKINQRNLLRMIDAPIPTAYISGSGERISCLPDGSYFIKPITGSSAKGAYSIVKSKEKICVKGKILSIPQFLDWYKSEHKASSILVEELLTDNFFDTLMDYKAYCFYGHGVDHVLCMQRDDGIKGSCFSKFGAPLQIGKYTSSPLDQFPPADSIRQVASIAEELSKKIPLSFCRLDFYLTKKGVILGEMTPIPGHSADFDAEKNIELGNKWRASRNLLDKELKNIPSVEYFYKNKVLFI
ncbi:MAG: ATP-grasp fold amidoligase family protein [Pseudomonadota bacterium]